jgi:hypothetical protein
MSFVAIMQQTIKLHITKHSRHCISMSLLGGYHWQAIDTNNTNFSALITLAKWCFDSSAISCIVLNADDFWSVKSIDSADSDRIVYFGSMVSLSHYLSVWSSFSPTPFNNVFYQVLIVCLLIHHSNSGLYHYFHTFLIRDYFLSLTKVE